MKYFVRTTPDRIFDYSDKIEYEVLVDSEHKPTQSFIKQLRIISEYDAVLLEDDCLLCDNFKEEIEKVIKKHKKMIINFFYNPKEYFTSHVQEHFMWNQCTYYPKGMGALLADKMEEIIKREKIVYIGYDALENKALQELQIVNYAHRPCLVQHIGYSSLIDKCLVHKDTIYFKDYLDELGIDYSDAYSSDNKEKLTKLRNKHRQNYI